jgi:hypothetical protein
MPSRSRIRYLGVSRIGEGLDDLLGCPDSGGMISHVEMRHLATMVFQYEEREQHPHGGRRHREEVDRHQLADVVVKKHLLRLSRWPAECSENSGDGARRSRCRASSIRREFSAHATADWQPPFVRSTDESRQQSPVCRVVVGSPWKVAPRTCEGAPAASGRPCQAVRKLRRRASRSRSGTAQPRTGDRRKSNTGRLHFRWAAAS